MLTLHLVGVTCSFIFITYIASWLAHIVCRIFENIFRNDVGWDVYENIFWNDIYWDVYENLTFQK